MTTLAEELTDAQRDAQEFVEAISDLSAAASAMLEAGLTRRAIVVLLRDSTTGVRTAEIEAVLDALPHLADHYLEAG